LSIAARLRPDGFLIVLLVVLALATLLPASGEAALWFDRAATAAITALFFLHGAKLSRAAILAGLGAWRLHLAVLGTTYVIFPLLGLAFTSAFGWAIDPAVVTGLMFLCVLPSTVQSSIAFTSIAGGNVPAAVCSASLSNVIGIVLTPLLAGLMLDSRTAGGDFVASAVWTLTTTLLLPFVVGHLARPLIGGFIDRHRKLVMRVDRSAILLVVYTAFSAAVIEGVWHRLSLADLAMIALLDAVLLTAVLLFTNFTARAAGFSREDRIVLVFCGSKKSLASGVPMAGALFPAAQVGVMILPLMLFHQLQLIVCAALAQAYARHHTEPKEMRHALRGA
jgi:sodium/bile acid cotransporter 7